MIALKGFVRCSPARKFQRYFNRAHNQVLNMQQISELLPSNLNALIAGSERYQITEKLASIHQKINRRQLLAPCEYIKAINLFTAGTSIRCEICVN